MKDKLVYANVCIRYSSHSQDEGNSTASQMTTIENYVHSNGMEIENYYIDTAKTGRKQNRPKFKRLKADIESEEQNRKY